MIGVEAVDELLAMDILLVLRAAVPEMRVPVNHEDLFAVFCPEHRILRSPILFLIVPCGQVRQADQCHVGPVARMHYS
ncbi:hypothetical protein ACVWXN_007883 [Bradyrhizobium sp. i1.4.4]